MASEDAVELLNGRYRVDARIGAGGIATVYKAFDLETNQIVALKAISKDQVERDSNVLARFDAELFIGRKLDHPNIVRVHDFGEASNGAYFIVMDYIDGGTFADRIRDPEVRPPFLQVLHWLREIARGLAYAHAEKVVHRDLKPENVLLTADGCLKIADFGLARDLELGHTLTKTGETIGTPYYMSPEQLRRVDALDFRTDIYSFGIMAFETATGARPFMSENYQELAAKHMLERMPLIKSHPRALDVPHWFQDFVEVCAAKRREDRFQSMQEIVRVLSKRIDKLTKATAPALRKDTSLALRVKEFFSALRGTRHESRS